MIYFGVFSDIEGNDISVVIGTGTDSAIREGDNTYDDWKYGRLSPSVKLLEFGEEPVIIEGNSEGLFAPLKLNSATVTIVTKEIYEDLYSGVAQGVDVAIRNETKGKSLFYGYITPCAYSQNYTYLDELELEFVSPISSLESYKIFNNAENVSIYSFYALIKACLDKTHFYTSFYFPKIFNKTGLSATVTSNFLRVLYINGYNFVEDDEEQTIKSCKEVLEQICTYFGVSLVEHCTKLYFIDYNALSTGNTTYQKYNTSSGTLSDETLSNEVILGLSDYFQGGASVSFDDVYNKISCSCNLYEADDELEDVFKGMTEVSNESKTPIINTDYLPMTDASVANIFNGVYEIYDAQFSNKHQKAFIKYYNDTKSITTYWYNADGSNTTCGTAKTFTEPLNFKDTQSYVGASLCKISANKSDVSEILGSVDLDDAIVIANHRSNSANIYTNFAPTTNNIGTLLMGKVSLEGANPTQKVFTFTDKLKKGANIHNNYLYLNFNATYYDREKKIYPMEEYSNKDDSNNGANWIWMQIKVGNYYVGGNYTMTNGIKYGIPVRSDKVETLEKWYWTTTPSFVRLYFNNEDMYNGKTLKLLSNITWDMFLDKSEGLAFNLEVSPNGETPNFNYGDTIEVSMYRPHAQNDNYRCDCVFIEGFEVGLEESTIDNVITKDDTDVVYSNETISLDLNKDIVDEFDDLELDINTQCLDRLYSYSSVLNSQNEYNTYIYKRGVGKLKYIQEYNLIEQYYKHYKQPRLIFEADLVTDLLPYSIVTENNLNKVMVVDSYTYNVLTGNKEYKLIEYGD